jgi:uncharacterized protein (DUF58 family)
MTRLSYRLYLLLTALSYRLPRRLTKAGVLALTSMILAGAVGADVDQSVAFEAFALLCCLLGVALLWIPAFRGQFAVIRSLPRLATVNQPFSYRVEVRNNSQRAYGKLELLEDLADARPTLPEFAQLIRPTQTMRTFRLARGGATHLDFRQAKVKPVELPPLGPGGTVDARVEVAPLRRGPLRFLGVTLARQDPFGLVRSFNRLPLPQSVLVLPKRYPVPPLAFPGARHYQPGGVALASSIGDAEEFVSLRDYRPGDAFRRIHWRSWARVGRPIVKEYQEEFFVRYGLVLDTFVGPGPSEAFEEAVSVAASFACTLDSQESLLDLLFVGTRAFCFTTGRALGQSSQVLEVLASAGPSAGQPFEVLRHLVLRHAGGLSGCICVFVSWDEPRRELVERLKGFGMPVLTLLVAAETHARDAEKVSGESVQLRRLRPGKIAEDLQALERAPL